MPKQAIPGTAIYQWDTAAWFGAQLGGTVWMLLAAAWISVSAPALAGFALLCLLASNALGTWLWWRRDRIVPQTAVLLLTLVICGNGLVLLLTFDWFWPAALPRESLTPAYAFLLGIPVVMAGWCAMDRAIAKQKQRAEAMYPLSDQQPSQ